MRPPDRGNSKHQVAKQLGVRQPAVSQWEIGLVEPSVQHFIGLVHLLGPSLLEVITEQAPPDGPIEPEDPTGLRPGSMGSQ
jgi:transcriptional regulator with XRE-family HTH domain